jgi:TPP-dependent 2-oxoacid decarboxylase
MNNHGYTIEVEIHDGPYKDSRRNKRIKAS